ncbi:MAG: hypothetical protein M1838_002534 [Thelocarpon superellum]|nr:MAG: hypothetical protein M1838_002534 [Thelocarpon superellum]
MVQYRVEVSTNNRAGCKDSTCKANGVKILKGELRFATQVTIQENTSWVYKHWGCVTPKVVDNLKQQIDNNLELLDGYDELPADVQEKVRRALENGHVDDEDWKGDVEKNRPGMTGTHSRTPRQKKQQEAETTTDADGTHEETPSKPATKKRARAKKDQADGEAPVAKKATASGKAAKLEEAEAAEAPTKKSKATKATKKATTAPMNVETEDTEPAPKKKRASKKEATKKAEATATPISAKDPPDKDGAPKSKKSKAAAKTSKTKPAPADSSKGTAPVRKGRPKKAAASS